MEAGVSSTLSVDISLLLDIVRAEVYSHTSRITTQCRFKLMLKGHSVVLEEEFQIFRILMR